MIEFYFLPDRKPLFNELTAKSYPEILSLEGVFTIVIENKVFFEEPHFSILEFLFQVGAWFQSPQGMNRDMNYNSIDVQDDVNPLISFRIQGESWRIFSPWQNFNCNCLFTIEQLKVAIESVRESLEHIA